MKIALLFAASVSVMAMRSWPGLAVIALCLVAVCALAHLDARKVGAMLLPTVPFVLMAVLFGAVNHSAGGETASWLDGALSGLFLGARLLVLVLASVLVCETSTSSQQMEGLSSLMRPLRRFGVPVDDVATTLSLALRFIPQMREELQAVRSAQASRGASFDGGPVMARLRSNAQSLVPLFVGMFRRADRIACAMDARAYGLGRGRTSLSASSVSPLSWMVLVAGLVVCVAAGLLS